MDLISIQAFSLSFSAIFGYLFIIHTCIVISKVWCMVLASQAGSSSKFVVLLTNAVCPMIAFSSSLCRSFNFYIFVVIIHSLENSVRLLRDFRFHCCVGGLWNAVFGLLCQLLDVYSMCRLAHAIPTSFHDVIVQTFDAYELWLGRLFIGLFSLVWVSSSFRDCANCS